MIAAWYDQLCIGKGKSCRTTGILYVLAACATRGACRLHCGHCRSSKTTIASVDPLGGRSAGLTASCADRNDVSKTAANVIRRKVPIIMSSQECAVGAKK